jgi:cellulose synthase/poly-beta-1,6-N-acetylglucosamine synthase-like glycosyltransferase
MLEVLYVFITSIGLPIILYTFVPLQALRYFYWTITACFTTTTMWVLLEALGGWVFTYFSKHNPSNTGASRVLYIIPAYLDNEQYVIDDTLASFSMLNIQQCNVKVIVVYNCSKELESEEALFGKWDNKNINNVMFEVCKCENSRSKAENINFVLNRINHQHFDYIGIYDADHQVSQNNLTICLQTFMNTNCDIVQGQCAIRNISDSFLTHVVTIEFATMYNICHQGRCVIFDLGLFGGSNALWRSKLLKEIKMDRHMLTEDIDSSIRAILYRASIVYNKDMVSYELAPTKLSSLIKQRKRWAQGWFEVSLKHFVGIMCSDVRFKQKVGLFFLLFWRELFVYLMFHPICLAVGEAIQRRGHIVTTLPQIVMSSALILCGFSLTILVAFCQSPIMKSELKWYWFIIYICVYPFYTIFLNCLHIACHFRHFNQNHEWIVTPRK